MIEVTSRAAPMFMAHGAPTLAIDDTPASRFLKTIGSDRPAPRFILIMSAHWETDGLKLSAPGPLRTYHDFSGFPRALHEMSYPAVSEEHHVDQVARLLEKAGYEVELDDRHGLDHGAWVPLSLAYPAADIPVVAISLPRESTPGSLHRLGSVLAPLADENVLIVGSGSTTHNLRHLQPPGASVPDHVKAFDTWLDKGLEAGSIDYFEPLDQVEHFRINHPTDEHLLPLFFAFGARGPGANPQLLHRSYEYAALSMSYYRFEP